MNNNARQGKPIPGYSLRLNKGALPQHDEPMLSPREERDSKTKSRDVGDLKVRSDDQADSRNLNNTITQTKSSIPFFTRPQTSQYQAMTNLHQRGDEFQFDMKSGVKVNSGSYISKPETDSKPGSRGDYQLQQLVETNQSCVGDNGSIQLEWSSRWIQDHNKKVKVESSFKKDERMQSVDSSSSNTQLHRQIRNSAICNQLNKGVTSLHDSTISKMLGQQTNSDINDSGNKQTDQNKPFAMLAQQQQNLSEKPQTNQQQATAISIKVPKQTLETCSVEVLNQVISSLSPRSIVAISEQLMSVGQASGSNKTQTSLYMSNAPQCDGSNVSLQPSILSLIQPRRNAKLQKSVQSMPQPQSIQGFSQPSKNNSSGLTIPGHGRGPSSNQTQLREAKRDQLVKISQQLLAISADEQNEFTQDQVQAIISKIKQVACIDSSNSRPSGSGRFATKQKYERNSGVIGPNNIQQDGQSSYSAPQIQRDVGLQVRMSSESKMSSSRKSNTKRITNYMNAINGKQNHNRSQNNLNESKNSKHSTGHLHKNEAVMSYSRVAPGDYSKQTNTDKLQQDQVD